MDGITERLTKIMEDNGLSPSQMADRIGVQRSAISHLLSGRNRPSLDFVIKVLEAFPKVSAAWLLKGSVQSAESPIQNSESRPAIPSTDPSKTIEKILVLYTDRTVEEYVSRG